MLLGALGPVMTRTAAEVADGLLVMPFNSHRHVRERTLPAIEEGLARRAGPTAPFAIYPQAIVAMGRTPEQLAAATLGVRGLLAFYGSTPAYRPVLDVEGWGDLQPELNALSKRGDVRRDDRAGRRRRWSTTLAVRGTPEQCAAELHAPLRRPRRAGVLLLPGVRRRARRRRPTSPQPRTHRSVTSCA